MDWRLRLYDIPDPHRSDDHITLGFIGSISGNDIFDRGPDVGRPIPSVSNNHRDHPYDGFRKKPCRLLPCNGVNRRIVEFCADVAQTLQRVLFPVIERCHVPREPSVIEGNKLPEGLKCRQLLLNSKQRAPQVIRFCLRRHLSGGSDVYQTFADDPTVAVFRMQRLAVLKVDRAHDRKACTNSTAKKTQYVAWVLSKPGGNVHTCCCYSTRSRSKQHEQPISFFGHWKRLARRYRAEQFVSARSRGVA